MAAPLLVIAYSIPGTDMTSSGSVSNARPLAIHTCTPLLIASINACHDADELNFLSDEIIEIVQGQIKPSKDDKKSA